VVGEGVVLGIMTPKGEMREVQAKVVGIQEESLISVGGAMVNRYLAEQLYDIQTEGLPENAKSQLPFITARFDASISEDELETLKKELDEKGYSAKTIQDQIGLFKQAIDAVIMVLNFFAGIALLAASFGIVNTLLMSVQERTKEIGLMKAMGMRRKKVFMLFSVEAILIGFWGSLLGSLAGIGLGSLANRLASNTFLKDLVGFQLTSFSISSVLSIMLIVMVIAFLAGTLPAWRASKKNPIQALKTE
jgi:putative ABC transport system permease protein